MPEYVHAAIRIVLVIGRACAAACGERGEGRVRAGDQHARIVRTFAARRIELRRRDQLSVALQAAHKRIAAGLRDQQVGAAPKCVQIVARVDDAGLWVDCAQNIASHARQSAASAGVTLYIGRAAIRIMLTILAYQALTRVERSLVVIGVGA